MHSRTKNFNFLIPLYFFMDYNPIWNAYMTWGKLKFVFWKTIIFWRACYDTTVVENGAFHSFWNGSCQQGYEIALILHNENYWEVSLSAPFLLAFLRGNNVSAGGRRRESRHGCLLKFMENSKLENKDTSDITLRSRGTWVASLGILLKTTMTRDSGGTQWPKQANSVSFPNQRKRIYSLTTICSCSEENSNTNSKPADGDAHIPNLQDAICSSYVLSIYYYRAWELPAKIF